jgi:hypothetical protein
VSERGHSLPELRSGFRDWIYLHTPERTAKANLIRRQEETAATRSLLYTAKLMEENPQLLRLKELESLERLVEKVGRIDLHAGEGAGLDALLNKLVRLKADAPA